MALKIPVAHDFVCNWCWVGYRQIKRLREEFDIEIEWLGYELYPEGTDNLPPPQKIEPDDKPPTPTRFQLMLAAEGLKFPLVPKPPNAHSFNAHQAVEYAKTEGVQDALIERIYHAFWEDGRDINRPQTILELAEGIVSDIGALTRAMETKRFRDRIVEFEVAANRDGVYNLPTYFIGEKRLAEQPYEVVRQTIAEIIGSTPHTSLYSDIEYENTHKDRPLTFINMVSTIDGKIITGERNEPVGDLGSITDHFLMHRLERKADAILCGASSLRATGSYWNPETHQRVVVTRSGDLPWQSKFLTLGEPIVVTSKSARLDAPASVNVIRAGDDNLDWKSALFQLKGLGIEVLNVLGGSEINAQLLELELIDELFLTLAPKIKLGATTPTYAGGNPLPRHLVQQYKLVSNLAIGDEVFLRYRKN